MEHGRFLALTEDEAGQSFCEKYFLTFLLELEEKLDDETKIDAHFHNSMFADEDSINQITCTGLTLMHVNVLGGEFSHGVHQSFPSRA